MAKTTTKALLVGLMGLTTGTAGTTAVLNLEPREVRAYRHTVSTDVMTVTCRACGLVSEVHKPPRVEPGIYRSTGFFCYQHKEKHNFICPGCDAPLAPPPKTSVPPIPREIDPQALEEAQKALDALKKDKP